MSANVQNRRRACEAEADVLQSTAEFLPNDKQKMEESSQ